MIFNIIKKKSFLVTFIFIFIPVVFANSLLFAKRLGTKRKKLQNLFTERLETSKKNTPKIIQRDKKNYGGMPIRLKSLKNYLSTTKKPEVNIIGNILKNNDNESLYRFRNKQSITGNILKNNENESPTAKGFTNILHNLREKKGVNQYQKIKKIEKIKSEVPEHNPALTKDEAGNIYLVWEHGNELWWAINKGNDWTSFGKLTDEGGTRPIVVYEPGLFNYGTSEGLVCVWESLASPHKIMKSIGTPTSEEIIWTKPQAITSDTHNDYGIAMVMDKNCQPLVLWLQSGGSEDDTDLYYQQISMNNPLPIILAEDSSSRNQNQPDAAPIFPFLNTTCYERTLTTGGSLIPRFIPIFGGNFGYELVAGVCADFSEIPPIAASLPDYDPNEPQFPAFVTDLILGISLGRRINLENIIFTLYTAVIEKDENDQDMVTKIANSYGGDSFLDFVSLPIPLFIGLLPVGRMRLGVTFSVGGDVTFVQYIDQVKDNKSYILPQSESDEITQIPEMIDQNFPQSLWDIDLSQIDELILLVEVSMGAGGGFTAFGCIEGELGFLGGFATQEIYPCYPSDHVYEYVRTPFLLILGYIGCTGPWNGIFHVFENSIGSITPDPNSALKPKTYRSAGKDRLLKRTLRFMEDKVPIYEALESIKKSFQGTGSQYEGKTVLNDISNDVYSDGLPDLAKSKCGEVLVAWAKGFASSCLGSKVYVAEYQQDKWSNPDEITPDIDFNEGTAIVFDSYNNPMLVWSSASNEGLNYEESTVEEILKSMDKADLMYAQRKEGKWTTPKKLALLPGKDEQIKLASGPQGEITAVWINQANSGSSVYSSLWDGKAWSKPSLISQAALAESPQVIYTSGKPMAVWAQDKDGNIYTYDDWTLYSSLWDGSSWILPCPLSFQEKRRKKINFKID